MDSSRASSSSASAGILVASAATGSTWTSAAWGDSATVSAAAAAASSTMASASATTASTSEVSAVGSSAAAFCFRSSFCCSRSPLISSHSVRPFISRRQPASRAANLAFCPSLPMARDNCRSGTTTMAVWSLGSRSTCTTSEGLRALAINFLGSLSQATTSIFSPCNSLTILWIRFPRIPMQEPTGSIPSWVE